MIKNIILILLTACTIIGVDFLIKNDFVLLSQTENGIVLGKPAYEKRSIPVTKIDLAVIQQTKLLLSSPENWTKKEDKQNCPKKAPYSLHCALYTASIKIDGKYIHRRAGLQEVRFAIDDLYKPRWTIHRLSDFNNHPDTTQSDILAVLELALRRIKQKLES